MARTNVPKRNEAFTHEGALAVPNLSPEKQLRRSVLSCLLWEGEFYEEGKSIADRIVENAEKVKPEVLAALAIEARSVFNLRHVPLLLLRSLQRIASGNPIVASTIEHTIQRVDEMPELLALYWADPRNKHMIPAQMRKGLAASFCKFNEYSLAKYDQDKGIKLRDVLRLARPKPLHGKQSSLWKRVTKRTLATPDTWEVALSGGADKKETFERLIREGQLGYLALLRNLRNMVQAGVDSKLVADAIVARKGGAERVFPFRYIAAARAAPQFEPSLDIALQAALAQLPKLPGKTIVVVDVSGSMYGSRLSDKSDMDRALAGCALAAVLRGVCEDPRIYATAGNDWTRIHATAEVPPRNGMALVDAVYAQTKPLGGGGIFLKQVMDFLLQKEKTADRIVIVTDEQDCGIATGDGPLNANVWASHNYLINVASYKNGIGYGAWTHLDGFSEGIIRYIQAIEASN